MIKNITLILIFTVLSISASFAQTLLSAAMSGNTKQIESLLQKGEDINGKNNTAGLTALHTAATFKKYNAAEFLIEKGAKLNETNNKGETPLFAAVIQQDLKMIQLLLQKGADPNIANNEGASPLMKAINYQMDYKIIEALYNAGADISVTDKNGYDIKKLATLHKDKKKLEKLFSAPPAASK